MRHSEIRASGEPGAVQTAGLALRGGLPGGPSGPGSARFSQHHYKHVRSVRSSSQSIRSSAKARLLRVAPELSDPVRLLEVGGHEEVGQLGAGSGTERVETRLWWALELV
jgi:hypothetical protein